MGAKCKRGVGKAKKTSAPIGEDVFQIPHRHLDLPPQISAGEHHSQRMMRAMAMNGNGAIPQAALKQFLLAVTAVINNPATVEKLLALIERNERAVERFADEQAEIVRARAQLAIARKEHDEHIAQARLNWEGEERSRRAALEKDERKANATHQPMARRTPAEAEAAASPAQQ
jgi:hypothetical protein